MAARRCELFLQRVLFKREQSSEAGRVDAANANLLKAWFRNWVSFMWRNDPRSPMESERSFVER